jgi:hypothetical protein
LTRLEAQRRLATREVDLAGAHILATLRKELVPVAIQVRLGTGA